MVVDTGSDYLKFKDVNIKVFNQQFNSVISIDTTLNQVLGCRSVSKELSKFS